MPVDETQPSQPYRGDDKKKKKRDGKGLLSFLDNSNGKMNFVIALLMFGGALLILTTLSGWIGYRSGKGQRMAAATVTADAYIASQFELAVEDVTQENYLLAKERLEYILKVYPDSKAAQDLLTDILVIVNVTATPTALPPTATPSPTPDLRPVEDQYNSAVQLVAAEDWQAALDVLSNLRKNNPEYQNVEVDGMIFLCLRNRGINKIINEGQLEEGIYDFSLAEAFGPLDGEALNYQTWARLYLLGNAFWGAYPEQAAYYYGQLVSAAPSITDTSGVSAFYRYWASLLQQAENLAKEEKWCQAHEKMVHVLGTWDQAYVYPTATYIYNQCLARTPSATPTFTYAPPTGTPSPTINVPAPSNTPTPTTAAPADTPTDTPVPVPTDTFTPVPSDTPEVVPSDTPEGG